MIKIEERGRGGEREKQLLEICASTTRFTTASDLQQVYPNAGGAAWGLLFERLKINCSIPREFFLLSGILRLGLLKLMLETEGFAFAVSKSQLDDFTMPRPIGVEVPDEEGGGRRGGADHRFEGISTISFKVRF